MKVSKVNHAKTAVRVSAEGKGQEGFIYVDPSEKGKAVRNLSNRVGKRTSQAQKLYNVFNAFDLTEQDLRERKKINDAVTGNYDLTEQDLPELQEIHDAVNGYYDRKTRVRVSGLGKDIREKCGYDVKRVKEHLLRNGINSSYDANIVDFAINRFLRKSLSHDNSKQGFKNILSVYTGCAKWDDSMTESIACFLETYHADYDKSYRPVGKNGKKRLTKNEQMQKAVKNQNMLVQPSKNDDAVLVLSESIKSGSKKRTEKEAFSTFLSEYANLDDDYRKELRIKLRRLLVLYFYGYDEAKDIKNEWDDHEKRRDVADLFSKATIKEYTDKDGKQRKKTEIDTEDIRNKNISSYRNAMAVLASDKEGYFFSDQALNCFWIHHFENAVERITDRVKGETVFKLQKGYLSEKVWKDALNFMSIKYIAIGKAVYNFALNDIGEIRKDRKLGELDARYKDGISSFEYEQIKAEETLQRELSVNIAFAINNLGRATVRIEPGKEDFMLYKKESSDKSAVLFKDVVKPGLRRNILQFFGGISTWEDFDFDKYYHGDDIEMLKDMQQVIYSLRNESFHFESFNKGNVNWNSEAISDMFAHETKRCATLPRDKFYSNNLNLFYKEQDLRQILDMLYSKYVPRASQVPSFNSVFVRKNFPTYLRDELHINPSFSLEDTAKMQSALYYLFKEVYYCRFLKDKEVRAIFFKAVEHLKPKDGDEKTREKSQKAIEDFRNRCNELKNESYSLPQICQMIMTEQNQQNNKRKVQSAKSSKKNPEIFLHYKMLLFRSLMDAFTIYLGQNEFSFVKTPISTEKLGAVKEADEFLSDWKAGMYKELADKVSKDSDLQKWYICGRMLNGRQLNLMAGSMRSFIQYAEDVRRRADETESPLKAYDEMLVKKCRSSVEVLDLCRQLSGSFTHEFTDYFENEDDYAAYLKHFLAYDQAGYDDLSSDGAKLRAFCEEGTPTGEKIGIYYDALNPILNKNILQAKLFGPDMLLEKTVRKVRREDLERYYTTLRKIEGYKVKGSCDTSEEQKELNDFMELKNRIEFRNIADYGEMVNELLGQLINWSFLRERDLLYYQLGFHYVCLNNASSKPEGYASLTDRDGHKLDGAILHQVAAIYINGLPMYEKKKNSITFGGANASPSGKIRMFGSYEEGVLTVKKSSIYEAGLELFENLNEHRDIIKLRNYIDHFKYYVNADRSILDLYSEIHDRFFTYDMKYQKNVTNMLKNILLKHFVIVNIGYTSGKKMVESVEKPATKLVIKPKGITSDEFTYDGGSYTLQARSDKYLEDIAGLLVYPSKEIRTASLIGITKTKDESSNERSSIRKNDYHDKNHSEYVKQSKKTRDINVGSNLMAEAFKNIKLK